jgi:hypothetical protein
MIVRAWDEDYKKQNTQLTKKLVSKSFGHIRDTPSFLNHFLSDPTLTHGVRCRPQRHEDDGGQRYPIKYSSEVHAPRC